MPLVHLLMSALGGGDLRTLLDLYSAWTVRHLHLEVLCRWPGKQYTVLGADPRVQIYYRRIECKDDELCNCGSETQRYAECCKPFDQQWNIIELMSLFPRQIVGGFSGRCLPASVVNFVEGRCVRLHRALLQSKTPSLDARIYQPYGVRDESRISLSQCQPNRQQPIHLNKRCGRRRDVDTRSRSSSIRRWQARLVWKIKAATLSDMVRSAKLAFLVCLSPYPRELLSVLNVPSVRASRESLTH
jgi:hypothetical protein